MSCHHILVVEDEPDLRETLKELLELSGFGVITAANGQEGLVRLAEMGGACLILLDLMMPVMNGWQFLEELKMYPDHVIATIPVVITSAAADLGPLGDQHAGRIMKKPVDIGQLVALAREHCAGA